MVTDLRCHPTNALLGAWHTVYAMLLSNYKWDIPEIHTMDKGYFLKPIIQSQMIEFFVCVFFHLPMCHIMKLFVIAEFTASVQGRKSYEM